MTTPRQTPFLCVPDVDQDGGGSRTFRHSWRDWLSRQGIPWTSDLNADYAVLFLNAWQTPYEVAYRHKRRLPALRIVHRVDGAGRDYGRTDGMDVRQATVNTLADATVFQSDYSRYSTMSKYHIITLDGDTIYNPVDTDFFTPDGATHGKMDLADPKPRIITASWSPNRRKGAWRIPLIAQMNPDLNFFFVGQAHFENAPPNMHHLGVLGRDALVAALRGADVFLNLSENDPCPNIVLEAMAAGLPVLYAPSGGTPELVGPDGGLPIETDMAFRPAFDQIHADLATWGTSARQRTLDHFRADVIFRQYWEVVVHAQRRALPSRWRHTLSRAQRIRLWIQDKLVN